MAGAVPGFKDFLCPEALRHERQGQADLLFARGSAHFLDPLWSVPP